MSEADRKQDETRTSPARTWTVTLALSFAVLTAMYGLAFMNDAHIRLAAPSLIGTARAHPAAEALRGGAAGTIVPREAFASKAGDAHVQRYRKSGSRAAARTGRAPRQHGKRWAILIGFAALMFLAVFSINHKGDQPDAPPAATATGPTPAAPVTPPATPRGG